MKLSKKINSGWYIKYKLIDWYDIKHLYHSFKKKFLYISLEIIKSNKTEKNNWNEDKFITNSNIIIKIESIE